MKCQSLFSVGDNLMKYESLFSRKNISNCCLLKFIPSMLRAKWAMPREKRSNCK